MFIYILLSLLLTKAITQEYDLNIQDCHLNHYDYRKTVNTDEKLYRASDLDIKTKKRSINNKRK